MDGRMDGLSAHRSSSKEKDEAPGVPPQVFEPRDTRAQAARNDVKASEHPLVAFVY